MFYHDDTTGRWILTFVSALGCLATPAIAHAQSLSPGPTIVPTTTEAPGRSVPTRPQGLNPTGVSYSDCLDDAVLDYDLTLTGFDGATQLQAWAGTTDCQQDGARGVGSTPTCWPVTDSMTPLATGSGSQTMDVLIHVRDVVAHQNGGAAAAYTPAGVEACSAQSTAIAVTITVFFVPTVGNLASGRDYVTALVTDLVGPTAPEVPSLASGDGLFIFSWTPNVDEDTFGYDVYLDPPRGSEGAVPPQPLPCKADPRLFQTSAAGAGNDASLPRLAGISSLPPDLLVDSDGVATLTAVGRDAGSDAIHGLLDGVNYTVVVAAVDGSGNIGLPSAESCDFPSAGGDAGGADGGATVADGDGGTAGSGGTVAAGCLCSMRAPGAPVGPVPVLAALGIAAMASVRRRRR